MSGTKIVILLDTIKSIMVHKRNFLDFGLTKVVKISVLFHWYIIILPSVPETWRVKISVSAK